jgi:transcriptional regulator with GAF, ATPase, and Fis domain
MALRDSIADDPTVASTRSDGFTAGFFSLVVIEGADAGQSFDVQAEVASRLLIGKSPACDFRLSDQEVSRRHASLELAGRRLKLKDLGSTNGTFVDGIAIVEAFLRGGEILRIGTTALRVDERGPPREVALPARVQFGCVLGGSTAMRRIYSLCDRLAASDVPVVIEGETGTGKEQLALALHDKSARASGPFVVFDCTAVAPNLIESELFGHERGAFTGSVATRKGVFERAHGGTLLIDEIGDLPLELQPKLLRALERGEITRVGGERRIQVDLRLLFATRRDLDREVSIGRFRDDLFHRIAVARIELPPLRERHGDVALLAAWFCRELDASPEALPKDLLKRWSDHDWPGNVRELRNAVARRLALGDLADELGRASLSDDGSAPERRATPTGGDTIARILTLDLPLADARQRLIEEFEERYLEHVLEQHGGNVTRAAAAAGVARRHLQRLRAKRER